MNISSLCPHTSTRCRASPHTCVTLTTSRYQRLRGSGLQCSSLRAMWLAAVMAGRHSALAAQECHALEDLLLHAGLSEAQV